MCEVDTEYPDEAKQSDVQEYIPFAERVKRAKEAAEHAEETRPRRRKRRDDDRGLEL